MNADKKEKVRSMVRNGVLNCIIAAWLMIMKTEYKTLQAISAALLILGAISFFISACGYAWSDKDD